MDGSRDPAHADDPARLRQAVDASGEVIFMTDREGVITFVNPQFERTYGYTAEEVIGKATPRLLDRFDSSVIAGSPLLRRLSPVIQR